MHVRGLRVVVVVALALVVPVVGCGFEEGEEWDPSYFEAEDLGPGETVVDLPASPEIRSMHRLKITDANLYKIQHGCYDADLNLKWNCSSPEDGGSLNAPYKTEVGSNDTQVADNYGGYWGECVSLVKALSHNNTTTSNWGKGTNVFNGLESGTAIATFPGGDYYGHAAIFLRYVKNDAGNIIGIRIADQNWGAAKVRRHTLYKSGTGVADADSYFAILVP